MSGLLPLLSGLPSVAQPRLEIARRAYRQMMELALRPAETGGILLGPIGGSVVTDFHFDAGGACTGSTYSPDHITLQRLMDAQWLPSGLDMKGFAHSHPGQLDRLSAGDLAYIDRLLRANDDIDPFIAPIVLPAACRICPIVVPRRWPLVPLRARLIIF
ncbi:MAG: Mov34/MPN/PAD-1 family protein [Phycisphaerales bacterium JB039]